MVVEVKKDRSKDVYVKAERVHKGRPRVNNEYDYSELYSPRAKYTAEEKLQAVTAYVMTGTAVGAARVTGQLADTIREWKNHSSWWPDAYIQAKKERQEEMDGVMTAIVHEAGYQVLDRIQNGDEVIDKDGNVVRRKMSGKELATVMGITYDKRSLLRGDPTSRTEKVDTKQILDDVREQLKEIAKDHLDKSVVNVN